MAKYQDFQKRLTETEKKHNVTNTGGLCEMMRREGYIFKGTLEDQARQALMALMAEIKEGKQDE